MRRIFLILLCITLFSLAPSQATALNTHQEAVCTKIFSRIFNVQDRRATATSLLDDTMRSHSRGEMTRIQFHRKAERWRRLEARLACKAARLYNRAEAHQCFEGIDDNAIEYLGE
jgi:hypothetical protein